LESIARGEQHRRDQKAYQKTNVPTIGHHGTALLGWSFSDAFAITRPSLSTMVSPIEPWDSLVR
jgi:hypothetical protein